MMPLDPACGDVDGDGGCGVEIVARALIAHPGAAVTGAPERQVGLWIVIACDPHRAAAGLPLIAVRPGFAARLAGRGHAVGSPHLFAAVESEGGNETAYPELTARRADHHLAVRHQRRQRHVVAVLVLLDFGHPDFFAGHGVDRDEHGVVGRKKHSVAKQRKAAGGWMEHNRAFWERPPVAPQESARYGVDRDHLVTWGGDEHDAVVHNRRRLVPVGDAGRKHPERLEPLDVIRRDLIQGTIAPAIVGATDPEPVAILRFFVPFRRYRLGVLTDWGNRRRRLLLGRGPRWNQHEREYAGCRRHVETSHVEHGSFSVLRKTRNPRLRVRNSSPVSSKALPRRAPSQTGGTR